MRLPLAVLAVSSLWLVPDLARAADQCASACNQQKTRCEKRCKSEEAGDPECPNDCKEQASVCPQLCSIGMKHKSDPQKALPEAKALLDRKYGPRETKEERAAKAEEAAHQAEITAKRAPPDAPEPPPAEAPTKEDAQPTDPKKRKQQEPRADEILVGDP